MKTVTVDCQRCGKSFSYNKTGTGRLRRRCSECKGKYDHSRPKSPSLAKLIPCRVCGELFSPGGTRRKYCFSSECIDSRRRKPPLPPIVCAGPGCHVSFVPHDHTKKYCSRECRIAAHKDRTRARQVETECPQCNERFLPSSRLQRFCCDACSRKWAYEHPKQLPAICQGCGREYVPKASNRLTYCSRKCAFEARPALRVCKQCGLTYALNDGFSATYCTQACRDAAYTRYCEICDKPFIASVATAKTCGAECAKEKSVRDSTAWAKAKHESPACRCKECNEEFFPEYGNKKRTYCSDDCQKKSVRRNHRHRRRVQRKSKKSGGRVYRAEVFARDGWVCQLCGRKVNPKLKYPDPMSASLDHIVPISLGGKHETSNCQLAHLRCNVVRGNTEPAQMRLVFGRVSGD